MKIQLKILATAAALISGIIFAPAVYADGTSKSPGSMMGQGGMMQGGQPQSGQQMMGGQKSPGMMQGGQGGMMGMMGQMNQMMSTCNQMMKQAMMKNHGAPMPGGKSPDETPGKKKEG